jgi:hypothetical protein
MLPMLGLLSLQVVLLLGWMLRSIVAPSASKQKGSVERTRSWSLASFARAHPTYAFMMILSAVAATACTHSLVQIAILNDHKDLVFTRVGSISSNSATIWIRYPLVENGRNILGVKEGASRGQIMSSLKDSAYFQVYYREAGGDVDYKQGPAVRLSPDKDWTGTVTLEKLKGGQSYEYVWMDDRLKGGHARILDFNQGQNLTAPYKFTLPGGPKSHGVYSFVFGM